MNVICNGIGFTLEEATRYGLEIDSVDLNEVAEEFEELENDLVLEFKNVSEFEDYTDWIDSHHDELEKNLDELVEYLTDTKRLTKKELKEHVKNLGETSKKIAESLGDINMIGINDPIRKAV